MGAFREIAVMGPEIEKQKELLAEFARNNTDLELEYKVINVLNIITFYFSFHCLTLILTVF